VRIVLVNAGSSSLKCSLMESADRSVLAQVKADWAGPVTRYERSAPGATRTREQAGFRDHGEAVRHALDDLGVASAPSGERPSAVGHRIVHGGEFNAPVRITPAVRSRIAELAELAPLHNLPGLEALAVAEALLPDIPHVAVFDTAFHRTLPPAAYTYAVPRAWRDEQHVRRYGFHGSSYAWVSRRTAALLDREPADVRMVVLHLGNGASACAIDGGRSVDTSMGLSPAEGLVMGTRSGDVDPALAGYLARVSGLSAQEYDRALNRESGLLGLAGVSDFRTLVERRKAGDAEAGLAFDVTVHRIRKYVGAYAAVLGRLDALAFTGGIGERSAEVRAAVVEGLGVLGLRLDAASNAEGPAERRVSADDSSSQVWVVPTDEEREIGRAALTLAGVPNSL
jgi:acetate kinase